MIDEKMLRRMDKDLSVRGFDASTASLKFGRSNSKLDDIITYSMPAGHSCPFAKDCRSCATLKGTKFGIQDGEHTKFRCYTAIEEVLRPAVRLARWHNFLTLRYNLTKGIGAVVTLIEKSLPPAKWGTPTRVHVSGDFTSQKYFDAWMQVARNNPTRLFYAYTKALPFWVKRLGTIPTNFKLTASYGGTHDYLIAKHELKSAIVVKSVEEAKELGLELDHDDSHAYGDGPSFALLVHGQQPAGTPFAKAWANLKKAGMAGYGASKTKTITAATKIMSARGTQAQQGA